MVSILLLKLLSQFHQCIDCTMLNTHQQRDEWAGVQNFPAHAAILLDSLGLTFIVTTQIDLWKWNKPG